MTFSFLATETISIFYSPLLEQAAIVRYFFLRNELISMSFLIGSNCNHF